MAIEVIPKETGQVEAVSLMNHGYGFVSYGLPLSPFILVLIYLEVIKKLYFSFLKITFKLDFRKIQGIICKAKRIALKERVIRFVFETLIIRVLAG